MSAAAIDGISANGHRWKARISLGFGPGELGRLNDRLSDGEKVDDAEVEEITLRIVANVRSFAKRNPQFDSLERRADELELFADCGLEEVNCAMTELYDDFDWHRILVERPRI